MNENETKKLQVVEKEKKSALLFTEAPEKSEAYVRNHKTEVIMLTVTTAIFLTLGLGCLMMNLWLVSLVPFAFTVWLGICFILAFLRKKRCLYIYEDKICYKTAFKEQQICITPSEYSIELLHAMPRSGYTVKFIFRKPNGEKILTYKAVSLVPSPFQAEKKTWEKDLFAIGCGIINDLEVIKN